MKIAIASTGKTEKSDVNQVSGRAPFYLIFEDKKLVKVISNPFRIGGGGAGFSVAQMLANEKVNLVIAGNFGPNMLSALETKGIKAKKATGTIEEALKKLKNKIKKAK